MVEIKYMLIEKNVNLMEISSKMDCISKTLECIKEEKVNKVYNTEQLCEYLGVSKSVINACKRNGELSYSKIGRSYVFTQKDVDQFLERNRVRYAC